MKNDHLFPAAVLGITVGIGIAVAGWFIADAVQSVRAANRFVTVKGLSERIVAADLVVWPLIFQESANELLPLQQKIDTDRHAIRKFLAGLGFKPEEISESSPQITDFQTQGYAQQDMPPDRFRAQAALILRSGNVPLVKEAMEKAGQLVAEGVVLVRDYEQQPEFLFTGLNGIKPEMIAEATGSARKAAEQFAADSGNRVGTIRTAQQGVFTITDRDRNTKDFKLIRVVNTVEYFLVEQ
jgi:uncharacterized protein